MGLKGSQPWSTHLCTYGVAQAVMYGKRVGHLIGWFIVKEAPEDLGFLGSNPRLCTSSRWNESRFNVNAVMRHLEKDMSPWGPTGDPHESSATNLRGRELTPTDCAGSNLYCAVISGLIRKFPSTYGAMTELIPGLLLHTQQSPETHREHTWLQHDAIYNPRI